MTPKKAPLIQKKPPKLLDTQVIFRVSDNVFRLLQTKALEAGCGNNPNIMARRIVTEYLMDTNTKTLKLAVHNLSTQTRTLDTRIKYLTKLFELYLSSHFAHHQEIPEDQKTTVTKIAEKRQQAFIKMAVSTDLAGEGLFIEKMIADSFEEPSKGKP